MILIPDIVIVNTLNIALNAIRDDYKDRVADGQEERSVLYNLFYGQSLGKYNLYDNIKKLVITTPENPNHLEAKLSFDQREAKIPSIFVTLPSESDRNNSMSVGVGDNNEIVYTNTSPDQDEYVPVYSRRFATTYYIVALCTNRNEMMALYNLIKPLLVIFTHHLHHSGIQNLKIGGQDIRLNDQIPDKVFSRAITLSFEYEQQIPEITANKIFNKARLYWKFDGAESVNGPIEIL